MTTAPRPEQRRVALHRELLRRGRVRASIEWRDARDRLIASDPGLSQLRLAIRVLVAIGTILALELLLARVLGVSATLPMLIGAVIAMVTSSGIRENTRTRTLTAVAPVLPAAAIGVTLSVLTVDSRPLSVIGFVLLSFLAVWVRRFGGAWITYGLVCWQAYFFVQFLHPPRSALPEILAAVTVAAVWVTIVLSTLLYEDPAARLRRTVTALRARVRSAVSACLDVLDDPDDAGAVRRLRGHLVRVSEVALLFDGQLSEARAIPPGATPTALRQWVVEVEIGMDELVRVVRRLVDPQTGVPAADLAEVRPLLKALGWGDSDAATALSRTVAARADLHPAVRRVGAVAGYLVATIGRWSSGDLLHDNNNGSDDDHGSDGDDDDVDDDENSAGTDGADGAGGEGGAGAGDGAGGEGGAGAVDDRHRRSSDDGFEPVIILRAGKLPGTAAVAAEAVGSESAPWWSPTGLRLTTRQAIQAAIAAGLAVVVGHLVSPQRYYWAVIAAFIAFTGTATASETVRRSIGRVVGTTAGLVAAVLLANVTAGHTVLVFVVLLVSLGLAWYLIAISYSAMIFMITVALGQLYALLHTFSDQVLVLRLQETVVGAVIGGLVGALVLPASALRTLRVARRQLLETLADLLDGCAESIRTGTPAGLLLTRSVALDADARQVTQAVQSLIRGRFFGSDRAGLRRRVAVLGSAAAAGRRIAVSLTRGFPADEAGAAALTELAAEARRLAELPRLEDPPVGDQDSIADRVAALLDPGQPGRTTGTPGDPASDTDRVPRAIRRLADTLTLLTPRGNSGR
ncbi:FUSC family protein [Nakamurella lactea]|uniref:FUSC family protein n=1 Tax=Nakamurella lactea TaxID=459515 RepID=UPI000420C6A5|nr:FUSC family protein [Nakamurella lactea]